MRGNWECGVAISNEEEVVRLSKLLLSGFGASEQPQHWTLSDLEKLREPVRLLRESLPPATAVITTGSEEHPEIALSVQRWGDLSAGLPGWTRLTLEGVIRQSGGTFGLHDIYRVCLPMVEKRFPENKFPREKLRQQLQRIRDLGMIEFLGGGIYRRTIVTQS
jgi:hypothetical protein